MVDSKKECNIEPFQKWLPLKVLSAEELPNSIDDDLVSKCTADNLLQLGVAMEKLCVESGGIGLSAIQCGIPIPFFVAGNKDATGNVQYSYYFKTEYQETGDNIKSIEGCLSIKDSNGKTKPYIVSRSNKIRCKGFKLSFGTPALLEEFSENFTGSQCVVLQHEIDHHNFKLISDIGRAVSVS